MIACNAVLVGAGSVFLGMVGYSIFLLASAKADQLRHPRIERQD